MRCPYCHSTNNKVIDSRPSREANAIRRRRECLHCQRRFTTYEQVEETMPLIVKKDGRREPFQRSKLYEGIKKACEKRPVSIDAIENFLDGLEREMLESGQREIPSTWIGERIMNSCVSGTKWPMCASPPCTVTSPTPRTSWTKSASCWAEGRKRNEMQNGRRIEKYTRRERAAETGVSQKEKKKAAIKKLKGNSLTK